MPNTRIALEWLSFAEKSLETAELLIKENHYTDVIAIDLQQTIEKALKAVYAFKGEKIPRTHSLELLFNYASDFVDFKEVDILDLITISDYYQIERYPGPRYFMPDMDEISRGLSTAKVILEKVKKVVSEE